MVSLSIDTRYPKSKMNKAISQDTTLSLSPFFSLFGPITTAPACS